MESLRRVETRIYFQIHLLKFNVLIFNIFARCSFYRVIFRLLRGSLRYINFPIDTRARSSIGFH